MASRPKFKKLKAFRKAIIPAIGAYLVASVQSGEIDIAGLVTNPGEQLPTIIGSILVGMVPVVLNVWKNREMDGNPLKPRASYPSGYMWALVLAAPMAMLAGCITTTAPDGTVTTQLDPVALETAWATYERLEARKAALEEAERQATAREREQIARELAALEPELRRLARQLGL